MQVKSWARGHTDAPPPRALCDRRSVTFRASRRPPPGRRIHRNQGDPNNSPQDEGRPKDLRTFVQNPYSPSFHVREHQVGQTFSAMRPAEVLTAALGWPSGPRAWGRSLTSDTAAGEHLHFLPDLTSTLTKTSARPAGVPCPPGVPHPEAEVLLQGRCSRWTKTRLMRLRAARCFLPAG